MLFENRNGASVDLLDDRLVIRREGKAGSAQERQIAFRDLASVEFREAGIANGFIQFRVGKRKISSLVDALNDGNTIVFSHELNGEFSRLHDVVADRVRGAVAPIGAHSSTSDYRLAQLERLERLKDSGTLDEGEFKAEKARILSQPADAIPNPKRWSRPATVIATVVVAAIVLGIWSTTQDNSPPPKPSVRVKSSIETNPATPPAPPPAKTPEERLGDAFEAATGHRAAFIASEGDDEITTKPIRIVSLPFGEALLTSREIKDGCHACTGAIGIYYLNDSGGTVEVVGRWPNAVEGWGWGAPPPQWYFTSKFTSLPAIYASGGFMGQGITGSSATITELTPSGPVTSDVIGTDYSDEGAIVDDERPACVVTGSIANILKDQSFDVVVTGSVNAIDHYVKRNGKFVAASKIDWGLPCGS